jgi:hypothetical protein
LTAGRLRGLTQPFSGFAEPTMITPEPKLSSAWAMLPSGPGTTNRFSNPKARQSQAIAAGASS